MVEYQVKTRWINDTDFEKKNPIPVVIHDIIQVKGQMGIDTVVVFQSESHEFFQMSVWGENGRMLVYLYGGDTDGWKGKPIRIQREAKMDKGKEIKLKRILAPE